ncbi:prominin-2 [Diretmus argenteus]
MGPCESMKAWRWRGRAGAFGAGVGVLLLGLSLAQSTPPQMPCPAGRVPQDLKQPQYQDNPEVDTGIGFMANLVQSFLHTVQPNPFPTDLILKVANEFNQDVLKSVLLYQVGFLVCVAIGILYIVLMLIVGFFVACCRCCDNCGGKMYQEQTSGIHCHRRALYWSAFITTVIILAGNICMFRSNEALQVSVDQSKVEIDNTLDNLHTYLIAVPQQIDRVVNESYKTVQQVSGNLDAIGPQLGSEIQQSFKGTLDPALNSVKMMAQEVTSTDDHLRELNSSLVQLQSNVHRLQANVTAVKNSINQTISRPTCINCMVLQPELQKLTLDSSMTIPSLSEFQLAVDEIVNADLRAKVREVEDYFNSIPQRVNNDTKDVVQSTKRQLEEIKTQISQVSSDLPISFLTNASDFLEQLQREIVNVTPDINRAESIRWAVCVALCCMVLLVVVCTVLGLLLGPLGLSPKADPTERSCTANCGGTFLMMGAGFSFLFSWVMVVVLLLFLLGGNVYTLVCQPWENGELLKFIDTPDVIPGFELGPMLGLKTNLTITDIYSDCEKNRPLWSTLHLYELIDLGDLLNVSKYTEDIEQHFENTNITLSIITFLSPEDQKHLSSFPVKAKDVDFTTITQQINNISRLNLSTTADTLDKLANAQPDSVIKKELRGQARDLRKIQNDIDSTIIPQQEQLNSTIESLRSIAERINGTVGEVLSKVGAAQDFLNTNTTQIVKSESREFLDCQMGYFTAYADWANITLTQQVGRCGPVAGAVNSVDIIVCSHVVESLNAFWFSLGWCLIFFIPSIIFSIKLAKYYRRMDHSDVYE